MRNLKQNKTMQFGAGKPLASAEPSGGDNSDHAQRFLGLNPGVLFQDLVQIPPCWVAGHPWGQGIIGFPVSPRPSKASLTLWALRRDRWGHRIAFCYSSHF